MKDEERHSTFEIQLLLTDAMNIRLVRYDGIGHQSESGCQPEVFLRPTPLFFSKLPSTRKEIQ